MTLKNAQKLIGLKVVAVGGCKDSFWIELENGTKILMNKSYEL